MITAQEKEAIQRYNTAQAVLEPFKRILDGWTVEVRDKFQDRLSQLDLLATGDLQDNWTISVIARTNGVIVADFSFPEYGRLFDMRRVEYTKPLPWGEDSSLYKWVQSKVEQGQIHYSDLARRRGLHFSDPRVLHDLTYRISRSDKFKLPRRRWYNKGKSASVADLYERLQEAMREAMIAAVRADATRPSLPAS